MIHVLNKRPLLNFFMLLVFVLGLLSCGEDDGGEMPEVDPLVGTYTFKSAKFINEVKITINGQEITFSAGADATAFVSGGLLGAAPCDDPTNAALELRENGEGYFVCIGETNEEKAGSWEVDDDRTEITITLTNPVPTSVIVEDFELTNDVLKGRINNFPMRKDVSKPQGIDNLQLVSIDVEFDKVE